MTKLDRIESVFFKILNDLKDYLDDLALVGGWMPYVYIDDLKQDIFNRFKTLRELL